MSCCGACGGQNLEQKKTAEQTETAEKTEQTAE